MTQAPAESPSDDELLARFAADGGEAAFAHLVERHGLLVYHACLRVLRHPQEAEDAAQAVFLTLAHKARERSLSQNGALPGWLYRTAWHVALRARDANRIRQRHEREATAMKAAAHDPDPAPEAAGLREKLDAALNAVPEKFRSAVVLHHLQGRSVAEAAAHLRCSANAFKLRLSRGRQLLRERLLQQGFACSAEALERLTPDGLATAVLPAAFVASTAKTAHLIHMGQTAAAAAGVSSQVDQLTQGALKMLFIQKVKTVALVLAMVAVSSGAGVTVYRAFAAEPGAAVAGVPAAPEAPAYGEWAQWRGPTRDGVAPKQAWSWKWPKGGPVKLWSLNVGNGYASPILWKDKLFAFGREWHGRAENSGDYVRGIDAVTGKELWKTRVGLGPDEFVTSSPCTDGERVYVVTAEGHVTALDANTGAQVWQVNIVKTYKTSRGGFHGIANSPLLAGENLILAQGLALDRKTGALAWQNKEAMSASHASPKLCEAGGRQGVLLALGSGFVFLDPASGKVAWKQSAAGLTYMDPILDGGRVLFLSTSGGAWFKFDAESAAPDSGEIRKGEKYGYAGAGDMANPVRWGDHLYVVRVSSGDRSGMFGDNPDLSSSSLQCFDLRTLTLKWSRPGISGTPIVCDGKLILQGQYGEVRVIEATPTGFVELANARVSAPKGDPTNCFSRASFATPVLANGRLYCRFFSGDLVCLDVSKDAAEPNPDLGRERIVGEAIAVTGVLSPKAGGEPNFVVAYLTEEAARPGAEPLVYKLCAQKHNDNPGHLDRIAAEVEKKAHVTVTGTLMYDGRLSVNKLEPVDLAKP
ncbi:MAG: sigma-70 family RNA polymerase sigma factor [Planctomycetota bacterium]|nr:sigma-70 family RNA polymerase sigma factor [Planctomycetota bacterium]